MKKVWPVVLAVSLGACAIQPARLDQPFTLKVGETRRVGPDGLEVTLRSVSADSGCVAPKDCSTMLFNGSVAMRMGEKSDLAQIQAVLRPGAGVALDLDGYRFFLTGIRRTARGEFEASFIATGRAKPN